MVEPSPALFEALATARYMGSHRHRMEEILRHFHGQGLTIALCADAKHLDRQPSTVKAYARRLGLKFPDYVPMALREKKPTE